MDWSGTLFFELQWVYMEITVVQNMSTNEKLYDA